MKSALLGSSVARRELSPLRASRAAVASAVVIMVVAAGASSCSQPRSLPEDGARDGSTTGGDGVPSGGSTGSSDGGSSGGARGGTGGTGGAGTTGGAGGAGTTGGTGGAGTTGGAGGAGTSSGTGGAPVGSGGNGKPADAGAIDADAAIDMLLPGILAIAPSGIHDFGSVEVGITTGATTFTITNTGDGPTGALTLTNSDPTAFATSGCGASLAGRGSCVLTVTFTPRMPGLRTGNLTLSGSSGSMTVIIVSGTGLYRLTVVPSGKGTVTSSPVGLTCNGASCVGLFAGKVILHTVPGPDQRFAGWSGGGCPAGVVRDCSIVVAGTTLLDVSFVALTDNLVFMTSKAFAATLGAPTNYDKQCNNAATAAEINNSAGDAFVALISSSTSEVTARIGSARGWQRLDGKPVMDTLAAALKTKEIFNAVLFDDKGALAPPTFVMTGIGADGRVLASWNCADFSATTGEITGGISDAGAQWSTGSSSLCGTASQILCLGKTRSRTLKPTVTTGKRIWVNSSPFYLGAGTTPDGACQASLPTGVTKAAAFISTPARAATAVLSPGTAYVRPDGTLVGDATQIGSGDIQSGIWQVANGTYLTEAVSVWTGSARPDLMGTNASTCADWTSATGLGVNIGFPTQLGPFWNQFAGYCTTAATTYCVQTAP